MPHKRGPKVLPYDEPLSDEEIDGIEEALRDLKGGRFYTHEQVKKKLGNAREGVRRRR